MTFAVGREPEFSPKSREKVVVSPPPPPPFAGQAAVAAGIDPPISHTAGALKTGGGNMPPPTPHPRGFGGGGPGSGQCRAGVRPHPSPVHTEAVPHGAAQCRQPGGALAQKLNRWGGGGAGHPSPSQTVTNKTHAVSWAGWQAQEYY